MSGRYEQLGRQLRKVRTSLAKHDTKATSVALRRATHLASDLVLEQVEVDDLAAGIAELVTRQIVDAALAERLVRQFTAEEDRAHEPERRGHRRSAAISIACCAASSTEPSMPELPFVALVAAEAPAAESRAALTISGRHIVIAGRGGEGLVFVDDRPVGRPFAMHSSPTSKAEVHRDPSGATRITWESEALAVELGPDFATATRV